MSFSCMGYAFLIKPYTDISLEKYTVPVSWYATTNIAAVKLHDILLPFSFQNHNIAVNKRTLIDQQDSVSCLPTCANITRTGFASHILLLHVLWTCWMKFKLSAPVSMFILFVQSHSSLHVPIDDKLPVLRSSRSLVAFGIPQLSTRCLAFGVKFETNLSNKVSALIVHDMMNNTKIWDWIRYLQGLIVGFA